MNKKVILITLGVVILLSSVPLTNAQLLNVIELDFTDYDGNSSYYVFTNEIRVDGSLLFDGVPDNPQFNFINSTAPLADDGSELFWYDIALSALFEAVDTNNDGIFSPSTDQLVGAIVPLSYTWDSWNYSDFLADKIGEEGYQWVTAGPDLSGLEEVIGLHLNYTANMTITHRNRNLVDIVDWDSVLGHTRLMDIELKIGAHFSLTMQDRFKLAYQISGWDWTFNDSILVFMFSPQVRVSEYLDTESDPVREFSSVKHEGNRFHFGEGFLEYDQNATTGNGTSQVEVKGSYAYVQDASLPLHPFDVQEIPVIFTSFENFGDETLDCNFSLGIDSVELPTFTTLPTSSNPPEIPYNEILVIASIISIITVVIIFRRNSKNGFNDRAVFS